MAGKPFISARIPEELLEQLESRVDATGVSKSSILVDALTAYLNSEGSNSERRSGEPRPLGYFELWVVEQIRLLDSKIEEVRRSTPALSEGNGPKAISTSSKQQPLLPGTSYIAT